MGAVFLTGLVYTLCAATPLTEVMDLSPEALKGRAIVIDKQCNRCHDITDLSGQHRGVEPMDKQAHCVNCHVWILDSKDKPKVQAQMKETFPDWQRYLVNIKHFLALPDLGTLTRRVKPQFIEAFLTAPFDLRPHLDESMLRVRMSAKERRAVVRYFVELNHTAMPQASEENEYEKGTIEAAQQAFFGNGKVIDQAANDVLVSNSRIEHGKRAFIARGCPVCHVFGTIAWAPQADAEHYERMKTVAALAPDLRYVRKRITPNTLIAFLMNPQSVDPLSRMNIPPMPRGDAESIASFLIFANPDQPTQRSRAQNDDTVHTAPMPRPVIPLLKQRVTFRQLKKQVLGVTCVHCHMNKARNNGRGGPGNVGGMGFSGVGLDLETYRGIKRGLRRPGQKKRISVLRPQRPGEAPLLLEALLRRHDERDVDTVRPFEIPVSRVLHVGAAPNGMPLGLPPLSVADLSLVKTWLAQGARR